MKKLTIVLIMHVLCSCTSETKFGKCVGAFDKKDQRLEYKLSAWNLAIGIILFSLIAPPVYVAVDETFCPEGLATN